MMPNDAVLASMRRNHVASTFIRRHFLRHMPAVVVGGGGAGGVGRDFREATFPFGLFHQFGAYHLYQI